MVWADEEGGQNQPGRPDLHANFRLAGGGEEIAVHRPDGTLVDRVVFGQQVAGVSQGRRMGDFGGNDFVAFATPTPGRDNVSAPSGTPDLISVERRGDGALWVRFESEPGRRYRLLAKDDLSQRDWTPSTSTITATGPVAELAWPGDGASQRFLRVERLP